MPSETVKLKEAAEVGARMNSTLSEGVALGRASMTVVHRNAAGEMLGEPETVWNVITNAGRDYLHTQGYNTSGGAANGFCFIGLSNDTLTENAASTTLSNEIVANGLERAVGVFAHTSGTNTSTITKTFTATGTQSAQKAALFTAVSAGTMNHVLAFTQRNLVATDTLQVTFTITLG